MSLLDMVHMTGKKKPLLCVCLHGIDQRKVAFETMGGSAAHIIKELIERHAESQNLKHLRWLGQ